MLVLAKSLVRKTLGRLGFDIVRAYRTSPLSTIDASIAIPGGVRNIHYASFTRLLPGWLNVDLIPEEMARSRGGANLHYVRADLTQRHPFSDEIFRFGFAEDFVEHLDQADSLTFLAECYRTLEAGGVLRLSSPSLEGVLHRHYPHEGIAPLAGKESAYTRWQHRHFYSREELASVAQHIGFRKVQFVVYGCSDYPELRLLDHREEQRDLNLYVELTK